jgi:hypothetical protein
MSTPQTTVNPSASHSQDFTLSTDNPVPDANRSSNNEPSLLFRWESKRTVEAYLLVRVVRAHQGK